jgi:hypothetical protein
METTYVIHNGELYHYGVPGMRWGVRRAQKRAASVRRKGAKKGWSDDAVEVAAIKTKKVKQMSNTELKKLNERNQLEITNRDLKQKQNLGHRSVQKFIKTAGTVTAVVGAAAVYQRYGSQILDKIGTLTAPMWVL